MFREDVGSLKEQLANGEIDVSDLPLSLEPILWKAKDLPSDEQTIRRLMNDLELILYTRKKEDQVPAALQLLDEAARFVAGKGRHNGQPEPS
jgi:hypothetical protein